MRALCGAPARWRLCARTRGKIDRTSSAARGKSYAPSAPAAGRPEIGGKETRRRRPSTSLVHVRRAVQSQRPGGAGARPGPDQAHRVPRPAYPSSCCRTHAVARHQRRTAGMVQPVRATPPCLWPSSSHLESHGLWVYLCAEMNAVAPSSAGNSCLATLENSCLATLESSCRRLMNERVSMGSP